LAQAFMRMIREQTGQQLGIWIRSVEESHLPELESFAKGIQQDQAAVFAGLTVPYSTGPVEGHVNRLKLLKRSMYGRAKLPLLRARVLHVAEKEPSRYEQALMDQFAASPEGQAITQRGTELGWARAMLHYAITYPGVIPPTMTPSDLEEVVYDLFPRHPSSPREETGRRSSKNYGHFGTFSSGCTSCHKPSRCWHA
jgi:hypothetical protein